MSREDAFFSQFKKEKLFMVKGGSKSDTRAPIKTEASPIKH